MMTEKTRKALEYIEKRFGIGKEVFDGYVIIDNGDIWITTPEAAQLKLKAWKRKGIRLARVFKKGIKMTTAAMQIFGRYAVRNVVQLPDVASVKDFLAGRDIAIHNLEGIEEGQVIVKYGSDILGSALYRNGKLKNQIPKGRRIEI
ncbi:MAG: hypothetical protein DRQ06_02715 [Candidatus Hydrothermota bacterium]|uniref:rRNA small subunit methyltransferase F RNA-binding PUA-like domain-containing protein n=1 Tax=candidate division WOR-3 bacterium TaxID=2052148 RepID=A0A7C0XDX3_UNCW3|nr:MAG: hypothetical protein DRQ06_02715 [Candidatus Hydrothermae bacterium]HDM90758.1 hypothetical protein [candidate division WOR-3 bacterium]